MRARCGTDRGAVAVETTLILVFVLIPLVFLSFDAGRLLWVKTQLVSAAREGAAFAAVSPSRINCAGNSVVTHARQELYDGSGALDVNGAGGPLTVEVYYGDPGSVQGGCNAYTPAAGEPIEVRVSVPVQIFTPGFSVFASPTTVVGTASARIVEGTANG